MEFAICAAAECPVQRQESDPRKTQAAPEHSTARLEEPSLKNLLTLPSVTFRRVRRRWPWSWHSRISGRSIPATDLPALKNPRRERAFFAPASPQHTATAFPPRTAGHRP